MANPLDDENAEYLVLRNSEGQHSLWPAFADVPHGWEVVKEKDGRSACIDYINEHWTDLRPLSLVAQLARD
ncbi:MbtH family protein [Nonomuraea sp. ZG12]|uniref:MbtH family protein n=1 Tax=Nonomuraea sp. ZG12 TaxID=3452207 RepID=UPI003F8BCAB4